MEKERLDKVLAKASAEEQRIIQALTDAVESTFKAYQDDNGKAKLKDWKANKTELEEAVADLEAKYFGKPVSYTRTEAVQYLQDEGYKIKKSKFYQDAKKGKFKLQADNTILESDLLAYIVTEGLEKIEDKRSEMAESNVDKAKEEVALTRVRREKLQFEMERDQGMHLPKADVRAEIAMKLGAIEAGVKNLVATSKEDWIELVGGDTKKADELQETIFTDLDNLMNEYCSFTELEIEIRPHQYES